MHGIFHSITYGDKSKSRRCGNRFLGTAAQKVNLELVDIHVISKHSGNGIYNGQNAVFF